MPVASAVVDVMLVVVLDVLVSVVVVGVDVVAVVVGGAGLSVSNKERSSVVLFV